MTKRKTPFEIKRINKRKKPLPEVKTSAIKRFVRRYNSTLRHAALAALTVLAMLFVYWYQQTGGYLFKASILETPPPFTGTVYPVDKIPDWTHWTGDNKTTHYTEVPSNLLVALPSYNLSKMQVADTSLKWGDAGDDVIRNMKITYPVVYLGNYEYDHQEYSGSHPAVDIRMPVGTPVKAIANGRVIKVSMQADGFGHHLVIEHRNVPDPDNAGKTTTLYSAYNHMDQISVTEGQVVNKGQLVGTSGETGTATTPHLHFQIDRDSAPWHPYWPFTSAESQKAGLSFFEAVNAGLGLSNAETKTTNPMTFITKNLNYSGSASTGSDTSDNEEETTSPPTTTTTTPPATNTTETTNTTDTVTEDQPVEVVTDQTADTAVDTSLFAFEITGESVGMVGNGITITATDERNQIGQMSDSNEVRVSVTGVGRVSKNSFRRVDFKSNSIQFIVNSDQAGTAQVEVGKSAFEITYVDQVQPIASLRIVTDGNYQKGQVEVIKLVALDQNGTPTPAVNFSGTIAISAKEGEATFTPDRVAVNDFKNGEVEIRMLATGSDPITVRAQNGAIVGESDQINLEDSQLFTDVSKTNPNYQAIKYLEEKGIVGGYPDGTFKPNNTVNRVEALKMLMTAFDLKAGPAGSLPFSDTDNSAWYATTVATALDQSIVKGYSDGTFRPDATVNKAEYLKMLFNTGGIKPADTVAANPYADVPKDAWYAGFAYLTNKKNLLDVPNNRLSAGSGMTRGEVAETIYRLMYIQDNNLLTYSR
jgi:hypothetical protein